MALKFTKTVAGNDDGTIVLAIRQLLKQPFEAPDWLDLRVGWLLSITRSDNNDVISNTPAPNIVETIAGALLPWTDRYAFGLTSMANNELFLGYTNVGTPYPQSSLGDSGVVSSDVGIGTTNSNYYRPRNGATNSTAAIFDGLQSLVHVNLSRVQQHFAQTLPAAGGYATLLLLRFQRTDHGTNARRITMTIPMIDHPPSGTSADVLFTDNPSEGLLRAQLQATFPSPVSQMGPFTLSEVPNAFYVYWPFRNSKLRIHAMGLAKAR